MSSNASAHGFVPRRFKQAHVLNAITVLTWSMQRWAFQLSSFPLSAHLLAGLLLKLDSHLSCLSILETRSLRAIPPIPLLPTWKRQLLRVFGPPTQHTYAHMHVLVFQPNSFLILWKVGVSEEPNMDSFQRNKNGSCEHYHCWTGTSKEMQVGM